MRYNVLETARGACIRESRVMAAEGADVPHFLLPLRSLREDYVKIRMPAPPAQPEQLVEELRPQELRPQELRAQAHPGAPGATVCAA